METISNVVDQNIESAMQTDALERWVRRTRKTIGNLLERGYTKTLTISSDAQAETGMMFVLINQQGLSRTNRQLLFSREILEQWMTKKFPRPSTPTEE